MRSLLLVVLLGMFSCAQAGLILTMDGGAAPEEVAWADPAPMVLTLGIAIEDGSACMGFDVKLVVSGPGQLDFAGIAWPADFNNETLYDASETAGSFRGTRNPLFQGPIGGPADVVTAIVLTLPDFQEYVVELRTVGSTVVNGVSVPAGRVLDSFTVLPEPATLGLLGLGGVLALRRRKA